MKIFENYEKDAPNRGCSMRLPLALGMLLIACSRLCGQANVNYFPLDVGNTWLYIGSGSRAGESLTVQITRTETIKDRTYAVLHGLSGKDYWLRQEGQSILSYDPTEDRETVWYAFASPEQEIYETDLPGTCCRKATIVSRSVTYKGPTGEFRNAVEIGYPAVFQVGIEKELFVQNVGLVYRAQATGGPTLGSYDLIYARLGTQVVASPELAFSLSLDRSVYIPVGPGPQTSPLQVTARITLRNTSVPMELTFPTGQIYDLMITNENGDVVYRWSADKGFALGITRLTFGPGETNYVIVARPVSSSVGPLPPGKYLAEAWLTTESIGGRKMYSASSTFEVVWLR